MDIQSWIEALLLESPPGADFESPVLLAADADRIGDYVFETPGLPEMRGASAQLKRLNMEEMQKLLVQQGLPDGFVDGTPRGCLVYAAGGGILALVPESSGGKLAKALEQLYPESTGAATITCVVTPTSWQEVHKSFGALVERAGRMLRARKLEKAAVPFFEVLPFYRRCDACRKRPAVEILPPQGVGEAPEMRCRVCAAKRREGREHRSDWQIQLGAEAPKDLEEIGGPSKGYIGVVYADGNGIGDWFQGTTTIDDYRRRSKAVLKGEIGRAHV